MANNWAIVVGINKYDFLPDASLEFATLDALAVQKFLCREAGFETDKVLLCGDGLKGSHRATRSVLRDLLLNQLQRAQNADNLWFFFSGHGMSGTDQQDYLMTIDGNPQDLHDTAIPIHFVTDRLRACKARNIVLILDMCRNESRDPGQKNAESIETSLRQLVKARDGQQGIITLFSCGRGQSSYEIAALKQGAFTYALMEGLRRHTILKDLEAYLAQRVPELHQASGKVRKQVPMVIPEPGWKYEELILSHYATTVDVARLKEMAIDVESNGDFKEAIRLWEQVNLLAGDAGDRQRALNKIRDLIARSKPQPDEPQPKNQIDTVALESEHCLDYSNLRDMLKAGKWEEADQETWKAILTITGKKPEDWISDDWTKAISCKDLRTIDRLWVTASNGHFGFSIQKKIWEKSGAPTSNNLNDWLEFGDRIGWRVNDDWIAYPDFRKNLSLSPIGELPWVLVGWCGVMWAGWDLDSDLGSVMGWSFLTQRLTECAVPQQNDDLSSEASIDYSRLRDLLKAQDWGRADYETLQVMLQASSRGSKNKLDRNSVKNFPVTDLRTINRLWLKYSAGKFGFSIQKKIWKECGSPTTSTFDYGFRSNSGWRKFGERVGWKGLGGWLNPSQLTHNHIGELPALWAFVCYGFSPHAECNSAAEMISELPDVLDSPDILDT